MSTATDIMLHALFPLEMPPPPPEPVIVEIAQDYQFAQLSNGKEIEIDLFELSPGDWVAKDADNDRRVAFGTTRQDAVDAMVQLANDDLLDCLECAYGYECEYCYDHEDPT